MSDVRILVVEDESIVALDMRGALTRLGHTVPAVASSGKDAIAKAAETHPDLVLMDITLNGEMDGVEAAEHIKRRFNVPIVYVTAHADKNTLQRAKIAEPSGYIAKLFEERVMHATIKMALHKHKRERLREVTERKQAEDLLTAAAEQFRGIFVHSNEMILVIDPAGDEIVDVNPEACRALGYSREELLSARLSTVWPDDTVALAGLVRSATELQRARTGGLSCSTKSGEPLLTEASACAFHMGGRACVIVMMRDATGQAVATEHLQESNQYLERRAEELAAMNAIYQAQLNQRENGTERH